MKKTRLLVLLGLFFSVSAVAQRNFDVVHYQFRIWLNDEHDTIKGIASISVRFTHTTNELAFDLTKRQSNGKGMLVQKVDGANVRGVVNGDEQIRVMLGKEARVGDTATYIVRYSGIPADGLIISKNKYQHRTFFADNWPNRGHNWLPCVDDPADKASVEFIVTAPQHYQVVSNGIQLEETNLKDGLKLTHWKEEVPISTKVMVIGVADFAVQLSGVVNGCIPIYSWVYPEDRDKGFYDYAQAAEILPFFIEKVGPYGYKKLANVESKTIFGGLENANTIFYSETSINGRRSSETLLAHEIAHQWFGNMATEKSFAHLWLSEGFATYMTILYMENKYGKDTARFMLDEDRNQVREFARKSNRPVVDDNPDYMQLLNANSYQKGGWILHMLRKELGDSLFWKGIRTYYNTYAGKTADTDDFRKILEQVSGKDLKTFFTQWLYTPGIPQLEINWRYDEARKQVFFEIKQQGRPYNIPLDILIRDDRGSRGGNVAYTTIPLQDAITETSVKFPVRPKEVIIDPYIFLLFKGRVNEIK